MTTAVLESVDLFSHVRPRTRWLVPGSIVVLIVALQLVYFTGVISSDDTGYLEAAWHAGHGTSFDADVVAGLHYHCFARFVLWKPIQAALVLFPGRPWAIVLPSMLAALVALGVVGAFVQRHLTPAAAPIAMLIFGLVPVNVLAASVAVPDMVAAALAWLGVLIAAKPLLHRDAARVITRCSTAGLLIAAGYSAKETSAIIIPGLILFVLLSRARSAWAWQRLGILGLGAALWLAIEAIVMWHWTGDPLFHAHAVKLAHRVYTAPPIYPSIGGFIHFWMDYLRWLADPTSDFGPMGLVLLAGGMVALVKRTPTTNLVLCAVLVPLIYLSVGSTELRRYQPMVHQPRYLVPLLPGMAILASVAVVRFWRWAPRLRPLAVTIGLMVAAGSMIAPNRLAGRWYHASSFTALHDLFADDPLPDDARLHAAGLSANRLDSLAYWADLPDTRTLKPPFPSTPAEWSDRYPDAYVLVTRSDRRPPVKPPHTSLVLFGPALDSLRTFERIAVAAPPRDRLSTLAARSLGRPPPVEPAHAVELYHVPRNHPETADAGVD